MYIYIHRGAGGVEGAGGGVGVQRVPLPPRIPRVQGYLAHKKQHPPRTLQQVYA